MNVESDHIHIRELLLRGILGINQSEREKKQDILITMTLDVPRFSYGTADDIASSVNYRDICKRTIFLVENSSFQLIESLANHIVKHLFAEYGLSRIKITIDKPHALRFAESVGFTMTRVAEDFSA
jgi:D-erythro-7,8-dihydroneopterin triphosphate epimerase